MRRTTRVAAVASIAVLGIAVLAGCSSSSDSSSSASAAATAAASPAASSQQMLPPVIVEPGQTEATAKVGDFIDIVVEKLAGTTIDTSTPDLVEIFQGGEKDGAEFNPGAKALAPGEAVITVTNPDSTTYDLKITITE